MVQSGGINVLCVACGARGKHVPGTRPRLRERPCPRCGGRLRPTYWAIQNPERYATERKIGRRPGQLI